MKASFLKSLWCVCCGTGIFPVLRNHSTVRTLWHLVLMSLLTALIVTFGVSGVYNAKIAGFRRHFADVFGETVRLSSRGIVPEKRPQTPYFMRMPAGGGLFYTADGRSVVFPEGFFENHVYFIVWSDLLIANGTRSGKDNWQLQLIDPAQKSRIVDIAAGKIPALIADELRRAPGAAVWKLPEVSVNTDKFFATAGRIVVVVIFVTEFVGCLALALICTGCVSLISRFITGAAVLRGLTGPEYWRIGVYAGFPGLLIGGVCEALRVPYVTYGIIYATALVIYWLPASLACGREDDGGSLPDA